MLTELVPEPFSRRRSAPRNARLAAGSRDLLAGVRGLPGVTRVFPASSGLSRWFDEPITGFLENGPSVQAWVTVGVDRHGGQAGTVGLIRAYLRARLTECGFDLIEVRVRVALFD